MTLERIPDEYFENKKFTREDIKKALDQLQRELDNLDFKDDES